MSEILEEQGKQRFTEKNQIEINKEEIKLSINKFDNMMKEKQVKKPVKREEV